ncbi:AAA family ATPase [Agromyces sp. NPDC055661]
MSSGPDAAATGAGGALVGAHDGEPAASAVAAVVAAARGIRAPVVLIDGPSGAGKSTLADALIERWPGRAPTLVRLDDVYRGWTGLERAGDDLARTLLPPTRRGAVGSWRRWDWARDAPGRLEHVRPGRNGLVIEGCGAFTAGERAADAVRVWVDASDATRKRRALRRDRGAYDPYWELWERQWRRHVRRTSPERQAMVRLRAAPDGRIEPGIAAGAVAVHARE